MYTQLVGRILFHYDDHARHDLMAFTKKCFVVMLSHICSVTMPTDLIISLDGSESLEKAVTYDKQTGKPLVNLDPRAVIIANHQIYTDWIFIWYLSYLNNCAGYVYIVMKKSLEKIPILGWGMKNYNFIFLSRNWDTDRVYMQRQFHKVSRLASKCWLIIFPEGTNLSANTRGRSNAYAKKANIDPCRNVLLPRARGLWLACKEMCHVTHTIYDVTAGYSGVSRDDYAQDEYTLTGICLFGKGPKSVSLHISALDMDDIPDVDFSGDSRSQTTEQENKEVAAFDKWLTEYWRKKDGWMDQYYDTGKFPSVGKVYHIPLALHSPWEILQLYAFPLGSWLFGWLGYLLFSYLTTPTPTTPSQ